MSKEISEFEELARRASFEDMPRVDVRHRVIASIRESSTEPSLDRIAFRFLIGSMSISFLVMVVASLYSGPEPPLEMITPFIQSRL
jgi:hypothetical protein